MCIRAGFACPVTCHGTGTSLALYFIVYGCAPFMKSFFKTLVYHCRSEMQFYAVVGSASTRHHFGRVLLDASETAGQVGTRIIYVYFRHEM